MGIKNMELIEALNNNREDIAFRKRKIEMLKELPAAVKLRNQMYQFAPLFSDMPLKKGYCYDEIPVIPYPRGTIETSGAFSPADLTISISTDTGNRCGPILLHEMLHLHHDFLSDEISRDELTHNLHSRLIKIYPSLDCVYEKSNEVLEELGKSVPDPVDHDYLFYLKSLDLDSQRSYRPGRVFGYYMTSIFDIITNTDWRLNDGND